MVYRHGFFPVLTEFPSLLSYRACGPSWGNCGTTGGIFEGRRETKFCFGRDMETQKRLFFILYIGSRSSERQQRDAT